MKKKVGCPYAEKSKDYMFRMRMDSETLQKFDELCAKNDLSRSEISGFWSRSALLDLFSR